jgi:hypothetical protein
MTTTTFSRRDKIALPVAAGLGVGFGYFALAAPYGAIYAFVIIPLLAWYIADQKKLLAWQVSVIFMALPLRVSSDPHGVKETVMSYFANWLTVSVVSVPLLFLIRQSQAKK